MVLEILFGISFSFLVVRLCVATYNLVSRPQLHAYHFDHSTDTKVSILIPARNEELNLPILLESIITQTFSDFEIVILDDFSTDKTADLVLEYQQKDARIRLLKGEELPQNWLGKNWACHQLALQAKGEILLFLDADVKLEDGAIRKAIIALKHDNLTLLSVFPEQEMHSLGEKATVPIMHYLLLSMLPLDFIYMLKPPSMAAANGQFMMFDAAKYKQHLFHQQCKSEIVEDIRIMQMVKEIGLKGRTLLGNDLVKCRMYRSLSEGIAGFSKNLLAGFGNNRVGMFIYLIVTIFLPIIMNYYSFIYALVYFTIVLLMRFCISVSSNQSVLWNSILHPFQMAILLKIAFRSANKSGTKQIEWKGRIIR